MSENKFELKVIPGMFNSVSMTDREEHEAAKLPSINKAFIQNQLAKAAHEAIQTCYLPLEITGGKSEDELKLTRAYLKGQIDAYRHLLESSIVSETVPL